MKSLVGPGTQFLAVHALRPRLRKLRRARAERAERAEDAEAAAASSCAESGKREPTLPGPYLIKLLA